MDIKGLWTKIAEWFQARDLGDTGELGPLVDEQGLMEESHTGGDVPRQSVMVKKSDSNDKVQTLEKIQSNFNILIEQLQGINVHLDQQSSHQEELMGRMNKLPELLEKFPAIVENQKQLTTKLFEELRASTTKGQQFIETIEKIPAESARQTDTLLNMNHQLAAVADTDAQMAENFNKFNQILVKLNQTAQQQTETIEQMSKTFATSDRHLKYLMTIQNKRFMWIFYVAVGICIAAVSMLTGIILYLRR